MDELVTLALFAGAAWLLLQSGIAGAALDTVTAGDASSGDGGDASGVTDQAVSDSGELVTVGQDRLDQGSLYDFATQALEVAAVSDITPEMLVTIAMIESGGDAAAVRQEPRIDDASYGVCQVLLGTATWLHDSLGYTAEDATADTLLHPDGCMYFAAAYLHWLRNYGGQVRGDDWVIAAYNGGPGGAGGAGPQRYLAVYDTMAQSLGYA